MIENPIFKGFNPDPSVCRKNNDYYVAVSSFEWFPGIPIYHSKDLKNWELKTNVLINDKSVELRKLPSAKGIWAPCLTYCEQEGLFYVIYGVMNSMNARYFDVDNYLITAKDICGPWSKPVYLHSAGFDASIYHEEDGSKWIVSLNWETREGYEKPGPISIVEYSVNENKIIGYPREIWRGATKRGCIEAPHLTKHGKYYYIMCAEGGTGYYHGVTMGRSKNLFGPYEADSINPIVTAVKKNVDERNNVDHLKPQYFNEDSYLQKVGHGSYVDTPNGETYLFHLCARPFIPELCCTLGRETGIQKMKWTEDGWLRMESGDNLAKRYVNESNLPKYKMKSICNRDNFDDKILKNYYYSPRWMSDNFIDLNSREGYLRIRGNEAIASLNKVSLVARKLTCLKTIITTQMEFNPKIPQHSGGLVIYYDNMNYIFFRKYYSETLNGSAISIIQIENGNKTEYTNLRTKVLDIPIFMRLIIDNKKLWFEYSFDEDHYIKIGKEFETYKFSDEYCKYGEFTGTMIGMACEDRMKHEHYADFKFFEMKEQI